METLPLEPIELVAIDPACNIRRRWRVVAARDLFGYVTVETSWGRIGTMGRCLVRSFSDEAKAACYVAGLLRLRATANRRLGVGYVSPGVRTPGGDGCRVPSPHAAAARRLPLPVAAIDPA